MKRKDFNMDPVMLTITQQMAGATVRHVLTMGGGALATYGVLQSGQVDQFASLGTGMAMALIGIGWSWWNKVGHTLVQHKVQQVLKNMANPVTSPQQ